MVSRSATWASRTSPKKDSSKREQTTAFFLQGGGALGAYQGGAYAAMAEAGIHPDWVAGISIGAINAAIIAGNPPEQCAEKLKGFWDRIGTHYSDPVTTSMHGVRDFFAPAMNAAGNAFLDSFHVPGFMRPIQNNSALYDPSPMYNTLKEFIDFDYLNHHSKTRLSVGAVTIENGELVYFDSRKNVSLEEGLKSRAKGSIMRNQQEFRKCIIEPKHIMASGALIPSFPVVEIDGQHFCDGGLVSNTPVRAAYETGQLDANTRVIRADLWSREGKKPATISEAAALAKAIQFSSPPIDLSGKVAGHVHIVSPNRDGQSYNKDFDFSHGAIRASWEAGYMNMKLALQHYKQESVIKTHGTIDVGNGHAKGRL